MYDQQLLNNEHENKNKNRNKIISWIIKFVLVVLMIITIVYLTNINNAIKITCSVCSSVTNNCVKCDCNNCTLDGRVYSHFLGNSN